MSEMPFFAEPVAATNFSFLRGAAHPAEMVARAHALGLKGIGIADRNSVAGVVRAHVAAKACGLKLLIGAEITPEDAPPILLWAMDRAGYGRLSRLITRGRRNAPKGESRLTFADVAEHAEGLLAGLVLARMPHQMPHPGCSFGHPGCWSKRPEVAECPRARQHPGCSKPHPGCFPA